MTISEVAKLYDMPVDTIRYYEKIQLMDPVKKDDRGRRDYQEKDLRRLRFLKLMRSSGVSIDRIKEYVGLFNIGEDTLPERKQILIDQRQDMYNKIMELQNVLEELDYNIDHFDETLAMWERMRRHPDQYTQEEILEAERHRDINILELKLNHQKT